MCSCRAAYRWPMKIRESEEQPVVFVVDDDQSLCGALKKLFNMVGLRAETFSAAADFLKITLPDVPACLVLDIRLPGLSGLDVQSQLGKTDIKIPIIFMTGYGDIPMTVQAMKAGAVEFLPSRFANRTCSMPCTSRSNAIGSGSKPSGRMRNYVPNLKALPHASWK